MIGGRKLGSLRGDQEKTGLPAAKLQRALWNCHPIPTWFLSTRHLVPKVFLPSRWVKVVTNQNGPPSRGLDKPSEDCLPTYWKLMDQKYFRGWLRINDSLLSYIYLSSSIIPVLKQCLRRSLKAIEEEIFYLHIQLEWRSQVSDGTWHTSIRSLLIQASPGGTQWRRWWLLLLPMVEPRADVLQMRLLQPPGYIGVLPRR